MGYDVKPKMILFDVGGTLFDDGPCCPADGFEALRLAAENPDITDSSALSALWYEYFDEVSGIKSKSGTVLDVPLSAVIKYASMNTGLRFNIPMPEQEEIFDRYNSSRAVIDGVPELLTQIEALGIRTAVISNNAMSGEGLALAIRRFIPTANFEFYLTSADLLLTKPCKQIFSAAASYAQLDPAECWYCGDGRIPDVTGAKNGGMSPILLKKDARLPLETCNDGNDGEYLTINHWNVLKEYISNLQA